ncbi:MAG: hypothetical protein M3160_00180 [Candidatus Eremiobacteraeota bacterium]|nr:hypothetical protein [Candidatus Eremiobacteraeota bacterium]
MRRSIIDTESSRPAYVRRNVTLVVIAAIVALLIVYAYEHQRHANVSSYHQRTVTTKSGQRPEPPVNPPGK